MLIFTTLLDKGRYVVEQFQRFGFLDVNITSGGKIMKGTFYENRDGTDKDHFTITK